MKLHDPILTPEESKEFEKSILGDSQLKAYKAMELAGEKLADSLCAEFGKYLGASPSVLGLVGAGHNGGRRARCSCAHLQKYFRSKTYRSNSENAKAATQYLKSFLALAKQF